MSIGTLYLVGATLLLPGFLWIIPDRVLTVPVHFNKTTHSPDRFITFPVFCNVTALGMMDSSFDAALCNRQYGNGVHLLIIGMVIVLSAAIIDLLFIHCRMRAILPGSSQSAVAAQPMGEPMLLPLGGAPESSPLCAVLLRLASPVCQVLGAAGILAGCVVFLPTFSLANPPEMIWGVKAPVLGNDLFQVASVLYLVGAVLAIIGMATAVRAARRGNRPTLALWTSLVAFVLFVCVSCLFFVNARLPNEQAIKAGQLRLAASICLFCAVVLLFGITIVEVRSLEC